MEEKKKVYYLVAYSGGIRVWSWPATSVTHSIVEAGLKELQAAGYKDLHTKTETRYE